MFCISRSRSADLFEISARKALIHDLVPGEDFEAGGVTFRLSSTGVFSAEARQPIDGMDYLARKNCPHPSAIMGDTPLESVCVECGATMPSARARLGG
jgi:hypothetical protein